MKEIAGGTKIVFDFLVASMAFYGSIFLLRLLFMVLDFERQIHSK